METENEKAIQKFLQDQAFKYVDSPENDKRWKRAWAIRCLWVKNLKKN